MRNLFKISLLLFGLNLIHIAPLKAQQIDTLMTVINGIADHILYRNNDTNYIQNYGDQVALKVVGLTKINYFRVRDQTNKTSIKYRPTRDINLGLGMAYKFFAFDVTLGLGLNNNSDLQDQRSIDFQARIFSSKQLISTTMQYYQGYRLSDVYGLSIQPNDSVVNREDIRTMNFGLQYMYAFNYTKFSMKAPFVFNERQKKSAGSVIVGATFSIYSLTSDSSIVPVELSPYLNSSTHLSSLNAFNLGIRAGYMYTFVFAKHFFVTGSVIPGLVLNYGDYEVENGYKLPTTLNFSFNTMNSLGFNGNRFFAGMSFISDTFYVQIEKKQRLEVGSGKINAFVGYRFGNK